jgi:hypothetical protein
MAEWGGPRGRPPTPQELEAAYAAAPVPGCPTVAKFAATLLGSAILNRIAGQDQTYLVSFDAIEAIQGAEIPDEADEPLMGSEEAEPFLAAAVEAGAIAPPERDLLAAIMAGRSLADALGANLFLRRRLKNDFAGDVATYVEDLSSRTARFVMQSSARP